VVEKDESVLSHFFHFTIIHRHMSKKLSAIAAERRAVNNAYDALVHGTSKVGSKITKGVRVASKETARVNAGWDAGRAPHLESLRGEFPEFFSAATKSMTPLKAAQTAYGVIAARDGLDNATHAATEAVSNVPVLGEAARVGEDLLQVAMNPWTTLLTPLYAPYRVASGIVNEVTGRKEPIRPYDFRPTLGNALNKIADTDIPVLSQAAKLLSFIG
jgi:hypothetical protein